MDLNTNGYVAEEIYRNINRGGYPSGAGTFSSPSSNAIRINRNNEVGRMGDEFTREKISDEVGRASDNFNALIDNQRFAAQTKTITDGHSALQSQISDDALRSAVIRGDDRTAAAVLSGQRDVNMANEFATVRAESAACCCDIQKLIIEENGKTREKMDQNLIAQLNRELSDAKTVNANNTVIRANDDAIARQTATLLAHVVR